MPYTLPLLFFLAGIFIGDVWFLTGVWIVGLVSGIIFALFNRYRISFLMIACLVIGYLVAYASISHMRERHEYIGTMVAWDGASHTISGAARALLSTSEFSHKYRVTVIEIDKKPVQPFDISLSLAPNLSLTPGDTVIALGKFSFPHDTSDYMAEKQLWNGGMIAEFHTFHTDKIPPKKYSLFVRMRSWFARKLGEIFPPVGEEMLSGIILGQKNNLDPTLKESLKASGLMHIMVVSGSNVMMLIIFLTLFLRALQPWIRLTIIAGTIIGFVVLVGGDVPVWRAALMGVIGYGASLWGYRFLPLALPLLVASLLALINPLSIVYDIGFQLSFLSVICIISFGKKLTKFFSFLGPFFDEAMSLTIAATVGTFPITLFYFGTFSLVGPIANLFAAPAIPILMYGGILTLLASTFSASFAYILGFIPWIAVTYLTRVITFFGGSRWSMMTIDLGQYRVHFIIVTLSFLFLGIAQSVSAFKKSQKEE